MASPRHARRRRRIGNLLHRNIATYSIDVPTNHPLFSPNRKKNEKNQLQVLSLEKRHLFEKMLVVHRECGVLVLELLDAVEEVSRGIGGGHCGRGRGVCRRVRGWFWRRCGGGEDLAGESVRKRREESQD